jgi:eukaryotic-like serine/threonine-protein kinase
MNGASSDRNLLLGIVALQMDFISRDELIAAMHAWTLDKALSLSEILIRNGILDPADRSALENLIERHIARHGGDAEKSLSSLELIVPSRSTFESLDDPDISLSLSKLAMTKTRFDDAADSERTDSRGDTGEGTDGRFRIIRLHDEGGLGSVYLARDGEVNRDVALKRMKEDIAGDPQLKARFVFEAEITGNLEHPGIVPVYGKGQYADGRPYYAMRFIRGDTLKSAVDRYCDDPSLKSDAGARQREFQKLLRRFLVVCETMAYAHSRGIIHRDLKPRNIMLGPFGETLVVDWGLAKVVGHADTSRPADATLRPPSSSDIQPTGAGSRVGTPAYMSPEQARGENERLGPAADIYSLGATLYYMLTKQAPFVDQNIPEVLLNIERGEFAPPRQVGSGVDRALEAICLKAMQIRPEDRYSSCRALADDIERWLADQPVAAYAEPLTATASRWVRRRRQWVAAMALLLTAGFVGLSFHAWRLEREKERVEQARNSAANQLRTTREVLRDLLGVAGTELANIPRAEGLRATLAQKVLKYYKDLEKDFPVDSAVLYEMARVYRVIGVLDRNNEQDIESERAFQQSSDILERLVGDRVYDKEAREWLAQNLFDLSATYQLSGKTRRAEDLLQIVLTRVDGLAGGDKPLTYLRLRAEALISLTEIHALREQSSKSHEAASEAAELLERAAGLEPEPQIRDRIQWQLAEALTRRGIAAVRLQNRQAAEDDLRRAIEIAGQIPADSRYSTSGQLQRGTALTELGRLLVDDPERRTEAKAPFDQAIQILEPLAKDSTNFFYREALAAALLGRAALYHDLENLADAQKDWDSADAFVRDLRTSKPENPYYLSQQADVLEIASRLALKQSRTDRAREFLEGAISHAEHAARIDGERVVDTTKCSQYRELLGRMAAAAPR